MTPSGPRSDPASTSAAHAAGRRWTWLLPLAVLALGAFLWWRVGDVSRAQKAPPGMSGKLPPQPVTAAVARAQPLPVWLSALGTVTPRSLVNVMPRVAGLLQSIDYRQGQMVKAGQLLAQIDPRPFQIAVEQAQAQVEQTRAQLSGAQSDLVRYETLLQQDSISAQQVSDQRATVAQYKATLDANRAALDNARLQLSWTRITAPVAGLAGLRPVDAGNMVTTSGAVGAGNGSSSATGSSVTPIATIAQVQPVDVTFALPQQQIGEVVGQLLGAPAHPQADFSLHGGDARPGRPGPASMSGKQLEAQAWDARNTQLLASGKLVAADNQINTATGTLNLRAEFDNKNLALFPNQFVNLRLLVRTIPGAVVVPNTAVAVGAPGTYVYVIGAGDKVMLRKVTTGATDGDLTQIVSGLKPGERVVTDGLDRLRDGREVNVVQARTAEASPTSQQGKTKPGGKTRPGEHAKAAASGAR
ncbi:MAG: efflux RND transporter periplasmic adaptor subunit [Betaproteobacteria bacterium]|nr:efflux RND transporter periplasmic adaptor subunit [Betaproteobacteria bacterium]MDE2123858.1 efflux RND transporter periplasmic adaptor subunit [Betaproteobacteria bacterium]MDE2186068.1 efflux RND transporter periplasmic adaptor subunit [Betaproteobacteria bacterium]MDE2325456.1 efflux RND transporter periplasmic adaptor subunit [Betaproteobacteria bacterium]